ncbi:hypothetical protein BVRB_1g013580 [Beta vulgaris subsp. vulgaris]|nr:hypothetical protein BVRB_1g013580 [Beta vulgaris subsp. vulgaris]
MGDERTLKELGAPKLDDEPLCIVFPTLERPLKLNSGFLNLLPKFYGNASEDPHRHLKEFIVVCSTMKPEGIEQNQVRLHAFPFSLHDLAKDWLYTMSSGSITTWDALQKAILEKFFPASRIGSIRKEICGIRQHNSESLYEYWERFKKLCASCPQHQITDQLLIQYFYEGLLPNDRGMIDAASGGALVDKTPTQARNLIANMAQNTQQHSTRNDIKRVNEIDLSGVKSQLQENAQQIATLTTLVSKIVVGNESKARVCGLCSEFSHATDACPTLKTEDVNALGGFSNQRKYDPCSQTYNEGWKDHPNLRYGTRPQFSQTNQPRQFGVQNPPPQSSGSSLEDIMKQLVTQIGQVHNQNIEYQKKTDSHLHHLDTQIGQICTSLSNIESQVSGKLPSQPLPNPNKQVNAVTINRKATQGQPLIPINEHEFVTNLNREMQENRIPLLDAIKAVPKYSKLFNEHFTNSKINESHQVCLTPIILPPPKCEDPGSFSIPCRIGGHMFLQCMLDLGSAVNIMPVSFYDECKIGPLKTSNGILTMADGSNVHTIGLLDNVLIQIRHMFFLVDCVVLDTKHESKILLGRPFLKTARTLIDVANDYVILESNGERMQLHIFEEHTFKIEANATDYATYCLAQVGEANLEILLDEMANTLGLAQLFLTAPNESSLHE